MAQEQGPERSLARIEQAAPQRVMPEQALAVLSKVSRGTGYESPTSTVDPKLIRGRDVFYVNIVADDSTSMNVVVEAIPMGPRSEPQMPGLAVYTPGQRGLVHSQEQGLVRYVSRHASVDDPQSNTEGVRKGHNGVLRVLRETIFDGTILVATRTINDKIINEGVPLAVAQPLTNENFRPDSGTPLFAGTINALQDVLNRQEQYVKMWAKSFSSATLVITDGAAGDHNLYPEDVAVVVEGMKAKGRHLLVGMAIPDGGSDFVASQFLAMGVDPNKIINLNSTNEEIQRALGLFAELLKLAMLPSGFDKVRKEGLLALEPPKE